jgi:CAAX protease family protein
MTPVRAAIEVLICSDFPTQLAIAGALGQLGIGPYEAEKLSPRFVYLVSAIDTAVLLSFVFLLLRLSNERPRDIFFGSRRADRELGVGFMLVPVAFAIVMLVQIGIYVVAPFLRNVPVNPFQSLLGSPLRVAAFVLLVLVAGGIREELQRAFLLHRFEQALGGARIGLVITSVAFGLGHVLQGWDAAVVTALLGAFWAAVYLWRRSVIAGIVSHALFNVGEVLLGYLVLT